jgi:hypothetical protein
VQSELHGSVDSSDIPSINGQTWDLTLVIDTSAVESPLTSGSTNFAEFFNSGQVKVLRAFDFSVGTSGDFTIHLFDPVPSDESEVRIDIDNFASKTFFVHVNDETLLPTWNGLQLDSFLLGLEDPIPGGYFDGTDHLPGADPSITINDFTAFSQVRLALGPTGLFVGTPTSVAFLSVPEASPADLCMAGGMALLLRMRARSP